MPVKIQIPEPQRKQREFMSADSRYICYGGARGGGKSWALRAKAMLMALNYLGIRILIIRRTYGELDGNHITPLVEMTSKFASYNKSSKYLTFHNSSWIRFGYCSSEGDVLQYQGQEYDIIMIDEATQLTEYQFNTLKACLRGVNNLPKRMYLTCNPGGVGHTWVKRLFIDKRYNQGEIAEDYTFVQALVYDNQALMESDPEYVRTLQALPDKLRSAWLDGNWDSFVGQYYTMWDRVIHVTEPFEIPQHWRRYRALDYGLDMLAVLWIAIDEDFNAYVYKELHESNLNIYDAAQRIIQVNGNDNIYDTLAPPDMWSRNKVNSKMMTEMFAENGVEFTRSSNERVTGWQALAEWLRVVDNVDGSKTSRMRVFPNCHNLIANLPQIQADEKNPTDCATEPHDITHICDALRYFVIMHPRKTKPLPEPYSLENELAKFKKKAIANASEGFYTGF